MPVPQHDPDRATPALALLSFAAGTMDAIAFVALGQVFTSAMTGNTIFLGLALGRGDFNTTLHSLAALIGYLVGAAAASVVMTWGGDRSRHALCLEAAFLIAFAVVWFAADGPHGPASLYALIILSAVAMGIQGAVGRILNVPGVTTVLITSTYTAILGGIVQRLHDRQRPLLSELAARQSLALAAYVASALVSGVVLTHGEGAMPFLPLAAILLLLGGLYTGVFSFTPRAA